MVIGGAAKSMHTEVSEGQARLTLRVSFRVARLDSKDVLHPILGIEVFTVRVEGGVLMDFDERVLRIL